MNKLIKKFKEISENIVEGPNGATIKFYPDAETYIQLAKEAKRVAIEFAKNLMHSEITKQRKGFLGDIGNEINSYIPTEYKLMEGNLISKGDEIFDKFLEEYK